MSIDVANLKVLTKTKGPEALAAEDVARHGLAGKFINVPGVGWLQWDGKRWLDHPTVKARALEAVRIFAISVERAHRDAEAKSQKKLRMTLVQVFIGLGFGKADATAIAADPASTKTHLEVDGPNKTKATKDQKTLIKSLQSEVKASRDQADIWRNLMSKAGIGNLLALASGMPEIVVKHEDLDNHPDLIVVENGIVDLRTGKLSPHDPALLLTKRAYGSHDPTARCPHWDNAIKAIHPELGDWLQIRLGQSATGHTPDDDVMFICSGGGSNGKTTLIGAVRRALGDYAGLIPHRALLSGNSSHSTELTQFRGLRMAVMEETPEDGYFDMQRVKSSVGTESIIARKMRQDDIEFKTSHTMWINTNHRPRVPGSDRGTWRRLVCVLWPWTFIKDGQPAKDEWHVPGDTTLRGAVADRPSPDTQTAIISWVIAGAIEWYRLGMKSPKHPEAVEEATHRWRVESDMALRFALDYLVDDVQPTQLAVDLPPGRTGAALGDPDQQQREPAEQHVGRACGARGGKIQRRDLPRKIHHTGIITARRTSASNDTPRVPLQARYSSRTSLRNARASLVVLVRARVGGVAASATRPRCELVQAGDSGVPGDGLRRG
jgi:P4 family phage/plasmid primase-like protien